MAKIIFKNNIPQYLQYSKDCFKSCWKYPSRIRRRKVPYLQIIATIWRNIMAAVIGYRSFYTNYSIIICLFLWTPFTVYTSCLSRPQDYSTFEHDRNNNSFITEGHGSIRTNCLSFLFIANLSISLFIYIVWYFLSQYIQL